MPSILDADRLPKKSLDAKFKSKSDNYKMIQTARRNFERFCRERYGHGMEEMIKEYGQMKEEDMYDSLQDWIGWNLGNNLKARSIQAYLSALRKYLRCRGVGIHSEDARDALELPAPETCEKYALSKNDIMQILMHASYPNRLRILSQVSSGVSSSEMFLLQKKHFDTTKERIMIKIPASIVTRGKARTTFLSKDIHNDMLELLQRLGDEDYVYSFMTPDSPGASNTYHRAILEYTKKCGLYKINEAGRALITSHGFRAYFITKLGRPDPNLAKSLAGQQPERILPRFDRLTDDEKLEHYIRCESSLLIYEDDKEKMEILREEVYRHKMEKELIRRRSRYYADITDEILRRHGYVEKGKNPASAG